MNPAWVPQLLNRSQTKVSIQDYDCFSCFFKFGGRDHPQGFTSKFANHQPPSWGTSRRLGLGRRLLLLLLGGFRGFRLATAGKSVRIFSPILVGRGLRGRHTCLGRHLIGQIHMLKSQKVMIYHTLSYIIIHYHTLSYIIIHYHTLSYIIILYHTLSYYQCYQFKIQNLKRSQPHCTTPQRMSWSSSFSSFPSLEVQRNTSIDLRPKGPLQPNGKRSHDHSLKSWEHPWAIHNLSLQQESIRPAVSMRFPRNLYSRLVSPKKRTCF